MFYEKAFLLKTLYYSQDGQKNTCVESFFNINIRNKLKRLFLFPDWFLSHEVCIYI